LVQTLSVFTLLVVEVVEGQVQVVHLLLLQVVLVVLLPLYVALVVLVALVALQFQQNKKVELQDKMVLITVAEEAVAEVE
jgi:hypothetical protein